MQDGNTIPKLPTRTIELPPRQFVSFPATGILGLVTRAWLWWLRAYLNRERYRLQVYGRTPKTPADRGSAGRVKLHRAKRWGLYLDDKFQQQFDDYHRAWGEHEAARHWGNETERLRLRADGLLSQVDAVRRSRDNYKAQVGELVTSLADRLADLKRWKERCAERADVLHKVRAELSGKEWSADTPQEIAAILQANGYHIAGFDPDELEPIHDLNQHRARNMTAQELATHNDEKVAKS